MHYSNVSVFSDNGLDNEIVFEAQSHIMIAFSTINDQALQLGACIPIPPKIWQTTDAIT